MVEGWRSQASGARPSVSGPWKRRFLKKLGLLDLRAAWKKSLRPFYFFCCLLEYIFILFIISNRN